MAGLKGMLSGLAAISIAELAPALWWVFRGANGSKATGLAAVSNGFIESLLTPRFWILSILMFTLFFLASRLTQRSLRVIFFWIPTLIASCVGLVVVAVFAYLQVHFRNS